MHWLQTLDVQLFRFVNTDLANPICDVLMPLISGNSVSFPIFYAALTAGAIVLATKNPARAFLFLLMLAVAIAVSDGLVSNTLKHAVGRDRPFETLPDVRCLAGRGGSGSMPSSHAANWFAAAMVAFVFLPGQAAVPYQGPVAALVEEASWFILRGMGMKDAAIAAVLDAGVQNPLELAPA